MRRLSKSISEGNVSLGEWAAESEQAFEAAKMRGVDMILASSIDALEAAKSAGLERVNDRIAALQKKIDAGLAPADRMNDLMSEYFKAKQDQEVLAQLKEIKSRMDSVDPDAGAFAMNKETLEQIFSLGSEALENESVQKVLKIGGHYAQAAALAKSIVDSGYDLTTQYHAFQRIRQMDENAEDYLKAVDSLSRHVKKTVERINEVKGAIPEPYDQGQSP